MSMTNTHSQKEKQMCLLHTHALLKHMVETSGMIMSPEPQLLSNGPLGMVGLSLPFSDGHTL